MAAVSLDLGELRRLGVAAPEIRHAQAQQLFSRVAEQLAGMLVGRDVAAFLVGNQDRDGGMLDGGALLVVQALWSRQLASLAAAFDDARASR